MVDLLALMGDSSDNVPGVPGIGPKRASWLLNKYDNLDVMFDAARTGTFDIPGIGPKLTQAIIENKDHVLKMRQLVKLEDEVPGIEAWRFRTDFQIRETESRRFSSCR